MKTPGVKVEDITVDLLDELEQEWEEQRIRVLVRQEIIDLGERLAQTQLVLNRLELIAMLRARKLVMLGCERKELETLFGVDRKTILKWTKGVQSG